MQVGTKTKEVLQIDDTSLPYKGFCYQTSSFEALTVMHGEMEICGTNIWFADESTTFTKGESIKLSASVPTGKEATVIFEALCAGGTVTLPPTNTFYSVFHAAVTDKFGVNWNVVALEQPTHEE